MAKWASIQSIGDLMDRIAVLETAMRSIVDMTDAENPESYRNDDPSGCLDTVGDVARAALGGDPS